LVDRWVGSTACEKADQWALSMVFLWDGQRELKKAVQRVSVWVEKMVALMGMSLVVSKVETMDIEMVVL